MTNKYNAKKVVDPDHGKFDSKGELARYKTLLLLQRCGEISDLQRQCAYILAEAVVLNGRRKPSMKFTADFRYARLGQVIVEDFKGVVTEAFRIRQHLMKSVHGIDVIISRSGHVRKKTRNSTPAAKIGR